MRKKIIKALISAYLKIVNTFRKVIIDDSDNYKLSMYKFSDLINKAEYKSDPLGGLIDNVADPSTFFDEKESGRDCDDWARQWSIWGIKNGYEAHEYVVTNPSSIIKAFKTMHVITILNKNNKWYLMNYKPYGPYKTKEAALNRMSTFKSYKEDMLVVHSREIKE